MSPEKSLQMLHTDDRLARWKMKPVYARGDNFADAMRAAEPWRTLELLPLPGYTLMMCRRNSHPLPDYVGCAHDGAVGCQLLHHRAAVLIAKNR